MNGTVDGAGGPSGEKWMEERLGLVKGRPLDYRAVARACFRLDPVSLVHGVFFARKAWPWQPRIARALTSFIEASGVRPAVSGGVKRDVVINEAEPGATAKGYGTVPHHRVEYTAATITAYFTVDHAQFRSYGLSEPATALLEALADFEIATLLDRGLRLRTRCDLVVKEVRGERPDAAEAAQRVAKFAADCADELGPVTVRSSGPGEASEMRTTLAIRFPLGRYHANPWDRAVNEGASEWPPSPWRLLRALVATWHTRWPDLPAPVLDGLLDSLADPPSYYTPATLPGHTRHYLPGLDHQKGETGRTDLTLDPFLSASGRTRTCSSGGMPTCPMNSAMHSRNSPSYCPTWAAPSPHARPGSWTQTQYRTPPGGEPARPVRAGPGCSRQLGLLAGRCWRRARRTSARGAGRCRQERGGSATLRTAKQPSGESRRPSVGR